MELMPLLSTVLLAATVITILFALFSYLAFRVRERKAPKARAGAEAEPRFFRRYRVPS